MNLNNENYKKQIVPLLIYLFVSFVCVSLANIHFFDFVYTLADVTTNNMKAGLYAAGHNISLTTKIFTVSSELLNENTSLKKEIYDDRSLKADNILLQEQNQALSDQLGITLQPKKKYVMGLITSRSVILDYITINKGSDDGIEKNDVVVYKNILLGRVSEVAAKSAQVELVSNEGSQVPAIIANTTIDGVVSGSVQLGLTMGDILPDAVVPIHQMVMTSGLGNIYPNGLLIGSIQSVQNVSSQPFKSAVITPAIDITSLTYVFVIK